MTSVRSAGELSAALLAINPHGLKGAVVHSESDWELERWVEAFVRIMPQSSPVKRLPSNITDDRLLGGLDFAATMANGSAVADQGVLAAANNGIVILHAGTTRRSVYTHIVAAMDRERVFVERDGLSISHAAEFAALALHAGDDDAIPAAFVDRVAFIVNAAGFTEFEAASLSENVRVARMVLPLVAISDESIVALNEGASALGVLSSRVVILALATARTHAALYGRTSVTVDDIECAAALVFAPRAIGNAEARSGEQSDCTADSAQSQGRAQQSDPNPSSERGEQHSSEAAKPQELRDVVIRAAEAAIPTGLIAAAAAKATRSSGNAGRAGAEKSGTRGRQTGVRKANRLSGARLDLVATLRAAAPMQRMRRNVTARRDRAVELRPEDFRVRRCVSPTQTTTLFVVDASGSSALNRLAEVKGAIEMMLAEGYARRERVAVIAFRGKAASLILPATHALARARRAIAGMPAGGGTPLASALDLASQVALAARRDAGQVVIVVMTDGRANVARDGSGGRERAQAEALDAGRRMALLGSDVVLIDTSPRTESFARHLATVLAARYVALPTPSSSRVRDAALPNRAAAIQRG